MMMRTLLARLSSALLSRRRARQFQNVLFSDHLALCQDSAVPRKGKSKRHRVMSEAVSLSLRLPFAFRLAPNMSCRRVSIAWTIEPARPTKPLNSSNRQRDLAHPPVMGHYDSHNSANCDPGTPYHGLIQGITSPFPRLPDDSALQPELTVFERYSELLAEH